MSLRLDEIRVLSEDASKESIVALIGLMNDETLSPEEFDAAEEAFEEVSFLYAFPQTEEEERDLKICELIAQRLHQLQDLAYDFHEEEEHLIEAKLEVEVATRLLERAEDVDKADRQTELEMCGVMLKQATDECVLIEEEMEQVNDWMDCAHEMLTTEKYQELPEECLEVLFPEECEEDDCEEGDECEEDNEDGEDDVMEEEGCEREGGCCGGGGCK